MVWSGHGTSLHRAICRSARVRCNCERVRALSIQASEESDTFVMHAVSPKQFARSKLKNRISSFVQNGLFDSCRRCDVATVRQLVRSRLYRRVYCVYGCPDESRQQLCSVWWSCAKR